MLQALLSHRSQSLAPKAPLPAPVSGAFLHHADPALHAPWTGATSEIPQQCSQAPASAPTPLLACRPIPIHASARSHPAIVSAHARKFTHDLTGRLTPDYNCRCPLTER
jgi:hypothetical protein